MVRLNTSWPGQSATMTRRRRTDSGTDALRYLQEEAFARYADLIQNEVEVTLIDVLGGTRTQLHSIETKMIIFVLSSLIYLRMIDSVTFQSSMARSPSYGSTLERLSLQIEA